MWYEDAFELAMEDEGMPYDPEDDKLDELEERYTLDAELEDEEEDDLDYICWLEKEKDISWGMGC